MLPFKARHIEIRDRHYLLLPKLNERQMEVIGRRLAQVGFSISRGPNMLAKAHDCSLTVFPMGLCRSSRDPSDYILPLIPEILECRKEILGRDRTLEMYFRSFVVGDVPVLNMSLRMEALSNWEEMRTSGECGLTPDENLVARAILGASRGTCRMVTDFAVNDSLPFYAGRRLYFLSNLPVLEAASTLRDTVVKKRRNSCVPRDAALRPTAFIQDELDTGSLFDELGEWCSFLPGGSESSNCRTDWPCPAPVV